MDDRELLVALAQNLQAIPTSNENGADEIQCPLCLNWQEIKGHATIQLLASSDIEHEIDCLWHNLKKYF